MGGSAPTVAAPVTPGAGPVPGKGPAAAQAKNMAPADAPPALRGQWARIPADKRQLMVAAAAKHGWTVVMAEPETQQLIATASAASKKKK